MTKHERVGKLQVLKVQGEQDDKAVVVLHGFGADASDLFPLHSVLDPDGQYNWYFPEAPLEVPIGPGFFGRAWFPISLRELETGLDFTNIRPPGMDSSSKLLLEMLKQVPEEQVVLGGFSQGAMLATEVALKHPELVKGLLIMSGTLLDEAEWTKLAVNAKGLKFLSSHGQRDPVLPYSGGQKLYEMFRKTGLEGKHIAFPGGHEIPQQVIAKAGEFIKSCLA